MKWLRVLGEIFGLGMAVLYGLLIAGFAAGLIWVAVTHGFHG